MIDMRTSAASVHKHGGLEKQAATRPGPVGIERPPASPPTPPQGIPSTASSGIKERVRGEELPGCGVEGEHQGQTPIVHGGCRQDLRHHQIRKKRRRSASRGARRDCRGRYAMPWEWYKWCRVHSQARLTETFLPESAGINQSIYRSSRVNENGIYREMYIDPSFGSLYRCMLEGIGASRMICRANGAKGSWNIPQSGVTLRLVWRVSDRVFQDGDRRDDYMSENHQGTSHLAGRNPALAR